MLKGIKILLESWYMCGMKTWSCASMRKIFLAVRNLNFKSFQVESISFQSQMQIQVALHVHTSLRLINTSEHFPRRREVFPGRLWIANQVSMTDSWGAIGESWIVINQRLPKTCWEAGNSRPTGDFFSRRNSNIVIMNNMLFESHFCRSGHKKTLPMDAWKMSQHWSVPSDKEACFLAHALDFMSFESRSLRCFVCDGFEFVKDQSRFLIKA